MFYSRWRKAEEFLLKHGDSYPLKDGNGKIKCLQPFPQAANAHKLGALLTKLEQEFGLSPSARVRLSACLPPPPREPTDFDRFLMEGRRLREE